MVFYNALITGLLLVVLGTIAGGIVGYFYKGDLPSVCKDWNKYRVMEQSLFLTGVLFVMFHEWRSKMSKTR